MFLVTYSIKAFKRFLSHFLTNKLITYKGGKKSFFYGVKLKTMYSKHDGNIYYEYEKVDGADAETFKALGGGYAKDKNSVYCFGRKIKDLNPESMRVLSNSIYAKDEQTVYYCNADEDYDQRKLEGADARTFLAIGDLPYGKDNKSVFYLGTKIIGADPATFRIIEDPYSRDEKFVYLGDSRLEGADPNSFCLIKSNRSKYFYMPPSFAKDNTYVFCDDKKIEGADPGSFSVIEYELAKDRNHVYKRDQIVTGADPTAF